MSSIRFSRRKVLSAAALLGSFDAVGFHVLPASASPSPIGVHGASHSVQSAVPQAVFFKRGHKLETGFQAEIRSPLLGEIRALRIRMPDRQKAALKGVHVLYLLDGETFFAAAAAYAQWLEQSRLGTIGGVMVVGIENKDNRTRDLTPSASAAGRQGRLDPSASPQGGGAGRFLDFITGELRQTVEAQLPDGMRILRRTLIGHSFGGSLPSMQCSLSPMHLMTLLRRIRAFGGISADLFKKRRQTAWATRLLPARDGGSISALPLSRARTAQPVLSGRQRGLACQQIHWSPALSANFSLKACRCADRISPMRCTEQLCSQPFLML